MPLGFYLLDISSIESDQERSQFNEIELTDLAQSLISSDDLIHPILVTQINPVRFKVIQGHFAYFAAVKASEIDSTFDEIRAIIVPENLQDGVLEQYQLLLPKARGGGDCHQGVNLTKDDLRALEQRLKQEFQQKTDHLLSSLSQQQSEIYNLTNALINKLQDIIEHQPIKPSSQDKEKPEKKPRKVDKKLSISEINTSDPEALKARIEELLPKDFLDSETIKHFLIFIEVNRPFVNFNALYDKVRSVKKPKLSRESLITKENLKKIVRD